MAAAPSLSVHPATPLGTSPLGDGFKFEPINESLKKFDPEVESDPVVGEMTKRIELDGGKEIKINEKDGSVIRPQGKEQKDIFWMR